MEIKKFFFTSQGKECTKTFCLFYKGERCIQSKNKYTCVGYHGISHYKEKGLVIFV